MDLSVLKERVLYQWIAIAKADPTDLVSIETLPCEPTCRQCRGAGCQRMVINDIDTVPEASKVLISGYKAGPKGVEIIMRDRDAALKNIAQYLGMLPNKDGRGTQLSLALSAHDLPDEQLKAIVARFQEGGAK